jgi:hypothetical protein
MRPFAVGDCTLLSPLRHTAGAAGLSDARERQPEESPAGVGAFFDLVSDSVDLLPSAVGFASVLEPSAAVFVAEDEAVLPDLESVL